MICINCHREIPDGSSYCLHCGAKQPAPGDAWQTGSGSPETDSQSAQTPPEYGTGYQGNHQEESQQYYRQNYQQNYQQSYQQNYQGDYPQKPVSWVPYLVLSIIFTVGSMVCCCPLSLVFGGVAIAYSAQIKQASETGDEERARRMAKMALIWLIAAGVTLVLSVILSAILGTVMFEEIYDEMYYY